jgi:hypothetical protein
VRSFFERYAANTCVINGLEVQSVTHDRCRRLLMTGSTLDTADDWASTLAAGAGGYRLPCLILSGPSYTSHYASQVIRVGENGQLAGLLDGSALSSNEPVTSPPGAVAQEAMQQFLKARSEAFAIDAAEGQPAQFAADLLTSRDQLELVRGFGSELFVETSSSGFTPVAQKVLPALNALQAGYSRSVLIEHKGIYDMGWDSHSGIEWQSQHYEQLFSDLNSIMTELTTRNGINGGTLLDETTVVVISEMGRAPGLNTTGGKDHWTFTSAMLIGAGIRGGQVIGGFDDSFLGVPVDLSSGEVSEGGALLTPANLGATLLSLGGLDPGLIAPIQAALL